ncbi:MAG: helicase-exonuclease AddAB subunit AddB [Selenomonas sp.]|uniref:helicase-exonuclease AddAB subunit AddB n=1 Tax=Selenomonas sp. TaxID=2053611 RepID=UPI0025CE564A|nr:helicase-exonuclease AddAB subunit AddB [Selenomonas sp.]MCR5439895.1 helicase-exonuclease AddAB subunit AddB [Selenomonas sp.]
MTAKLDFIIGRAGTGKTHACLAAMREQMEQNPIGHSLVLILPEHMTYKVERQLASSIPQGQGFFRGYVFGFRRFARQVLWETGGADIPRISEVGRRLLLRKLLVGHQKKKDLDVFARAARQRGFTASLSDAIKEFKSYRLTTDVLRKASGRLGENSSRLASKLTELAALSDEFATAMQGRANDAEDMMTLLAEKLPEASFLKQAEVWIDGFIFFNPQERQVLAALLQTVDRVHITLPMAGVRLSDGRVNLKLPENVQETGLFQRSYRTMESICALAGNLTGQSVQVENYPVTLLEENHRSRKLPLRQVEEKLFVRGGQAVAAEDAVKLTEAANRRLEVEAVAADIRRLVREKSYRYHEVGVLVRDEEAYGDILRLVFQDYGIPFFQDSKRPSIHHPLAELIRSALEVVVKGWRYETVFRCLRTGFFPLVREDIDKLENYVLEFGIRGRKRWAQEEPWNWHRRYALEDDEEILDEAAAEKLAGIDSLRRQAMDPLAKLEDEIREAADVQGQTEAVYRFLERLEVPVHLSQWTDIAEKEGRLADAMEHRQIWGGSIGLLDQIVEISGEESMTLPEFDAVLSDGLDALTISLIPPGLDYVTLASFDQNSLDNSRAVYILGANAEIMPRRSSEQGLLTDAERLHIDEALQELHREGMEIPEISRGSRERSFGEKFLLYRSFNEAREYLWISYALADAEGNGLQPSSLVQRLQQIYVQLSFLSIPLETLQREDNLQLVAGRPAISSLVNVLRSRKEARIKEKEPASFWQDVYNWALEQPELRRPLKLALSGLFAKANEEQLPEQLAQAIYLRGKNLHGSVTQFEKFRQCPFSHFAAYGLKLQERREYQFRNMDLGQLLHAVLHAYGEKVREEFAGRWQDVPEEKRLPICQSLVEELAPRLQSEILLSRANYRHLKSRIAETAGQAVAQLTAWAALSEFQPAYFEEAFGHAGDLAQLSPLPLGNGFRLSFKGQIDRLDIHQEYPYFLVVDYKTGQAAINLFEVYYGLKLQLLVYVLVAQQLFHQQGEDRLPAGMLYAFLKNPVVNSEKRLSDKELAAKVMSELRMPGWVCADQEVIESIDKGLGHLMLKRKKDGSFDEATKKGHYVRTQEEFALLLSYVDYILRDTGRQILAGQIKAKPYRVVKNNQEYKACSYCAYRDLCGFDPELSGYEYHDIEQAEEEELERRMAECTGREDLLRGLYNRPTEGN